METPAETADRLLRGSSFGSAAAAYADHRPAYADDAIRWCLAPVGTSGCRAIDLGAGTGILTAALDRLGTDVTAIEPDAEMLAELRRRLPGVRSEQGSAEAIPVPDGSVDAVLAGQSMHWFDLDRAVPEIARVLVPGGVFAALWNLDDDRVGWVAELARIRHQGSATLLRWRSGEDRGADERLVQVGAGLFGGAESGEFPNGQRRTATSLVAAIGTHSVLLVMEPAERSRALARVSDFLRRRPETASGEFTFPMVTVAIRVTRRR